ncbi:conserved hypothetical protein [Rippkaea orientalis PCC 8801]|uniref:Uncharacterized protein n=1 Tax=Rippkaea orientalis (strain PCC 8801 / RF-1) TaxID=41431 RepID=B7JW35_RIPO1|nr:hypothetical protein [Rippkaea orientalis]ACK65724.1 conserved hypothetical protein [Rippkaea orientalis PCC 8801]
MATINHKKIYNFHYQELIGKQGEAILDEWLKSIYKILDVSSIEKYQKMGIDRLLMRSDGSIITVEYKFDLASARTGNLFFETISVDTKNLTGWGWSSQADYWIFLIPTPEIIVIEPNKLRNLVWELRSILKEKKVPNINYNTWGVIIPLKQVKKIAHYQKKL